MCALAGAAGTGEARGRGADHVVGVVEPGVVQQVFGHAEHLLEGRAGHGPDPPGVLGVRGGHCTGHAGDLRAEMGSGELAADTRLPGELELADQYGVNRDTIRRAIQELASEGRVVVLHGRRTFVDLGPSSPAPCGAAPGHDRIVAGLRWGIAWALW